MLVLFQIYKGHTDQMGKPPSCATYRMRGERAWCDILCSSRIQGLPPLQHPRESTVLMVISIQINYGFGVSSHNVFVVVFIRLWEGSTLTLTPRTHTQHTEVDARVGRSVLWVTPCQSCLRLELSARPSDVKMPVSKSPVFSLSKLTG